MIFNSKLLKIYNLFHILNKHKVYKIQNIIKTENKLLTIWIINGLNMKTVLILKKNLF